MPQLGSLGQERGASSEHRGKGVFSLAGAPHVGGESLTRPEVAAHQIGMTATITPTLLEQIRGEFIEMPGLRLTLRQAMRLWNLDALTCDVALRTLVEDGFLRQTRQQKFLRVQGI